MIDRGMAFGKAVDLAQAQPQAQRALFVAFQRAIPVAEGGIGLQHRRRHARVHQRTISAGA